MKLVIKLPEFSFEFLRKYVYFISEGDTLKSCNFNPRGGFKKRRVPRSKHHFKSLFNSLHGSVHIFEL